MKKYLTLIILIVLIGLAVYFILPRQQEGVPNQQEIYIVESPVASSITQEGDKSSILWTKYHSSIYGFSIDLPSEIYDTSAPLTVFEKADTQTIYFAPAVNADGERNTYASIDSKRQNKEYIRASELTIQSVSDQKELSQFIQKYYQNIGCILGNLIEIDGSEDYSFQFLDANGTDLCFTSAVIFRRYSPKYQKVAIGLGYSDDLFWIKSDTGTVDLTDRVLGSFQFEK